MSCQRDKSFYAPRKASVLYDDSVKVNKRVFTALLALEKSASAFEPYANAEVSAPNGKEIALQNLRAALANLAAVRKEVA